MKFAINLLLLSLFFASCQNNTETGALAGAGVGALAGGLIGGNATGALIGGAVGAAGGALIGYGLDEQERKSMQQNSPQTLQKIDNKQQLSVEDVENMAKNGLSDDVIIHQIQNTKSTFNLTADQIIDLKNAGVSQKVIDYMIQTSS